LSPIAAIASADGDEGDARLLTRLGEVGALREEPVAGVDGVGASLARGVDQLAGVQVGLACVRLADWNRLVGLAHVESIAVGVRVHRDRR